MRIHGKRLQQRAFLDSTSSLVGAGARGGGSTGGAVGHKRRRCEAGQRRAFARAGRGRAGAQRGRRGIADAPRGRRVRGRGRRARAAARVHPDAAANGARRSSPAARSRTPRGRRQARHRVCALARRAGRGRGAERCRGAGRRGPRAHRRIRAAGHLSLAAARLHRPGGQPVRGGGWRDGADHDVLRPDQARDRAARAADGPVCCRDARERPAAARLVREPLVGGARRRLCQMP